jgi:biofilm PGA synthesis N-glycosyltransferase PgaC
MLGWRALSWDSPELRFEHLRPMGSSQVSIYEGRRRHGYGQYFMGSDPVYFAATAAFRALEPPYVLGGLAMMQGYFGAMVRGKPRLDDPALIAFIRSYQRRALTRGRAVAIAEVDARQRTAFPRPTGGAS